MKIFISVRDLDQLDRQDPAYAVVKKHIERMADMYPDNGYLILIEQADLGNLIVLPELTVDLLSAGWEGVSRIEEFFYAVYLTNNEFALEFLIPDADWIDGALRESLEDAEI